MKVFSELFLKRFKDAFFYLVIPAAYPKPVRDGEGICKDDRSWEPVLSGQVKPREDEDEKEKPTNIEEE